jgi:protein-histidine pros-kinase
MLAALMGSHLVAWLVVTRLVLPLPHEAAGGPGGGLAMRVPPPPGPRPSGPQQPPGAPPPPVWGSLPPVQMFDSLPAWVPLLDYGIRFLIIGAAAAWGARWLSRPMRRLARAADAMGNEVSAGRAPIPLSEHRGTVEVRETATLFNRMAAQLARSFRARGLLVASISHDLRTPLTRMRMRLENLLPDPRAQRCIDDLREMSQLVDGVIEAFGAESAPLPELQPTDLLALVQSLADDCAETGQPVTVQGQPLVAATEPTALRRAIGNLVGNALRHAGDAHIAVYADGGVPCIVIEDHGPGIPENELQRMLEPFARLDPSRSRSTGGVGLGLHIARTLLQAQGASLALSNRAGGGLRAEVRLGVARSG